MTLDNARNAQQVCTAVTSMFIEQNLRLRQEHSEVHDAIPVPRAGQTPRRVWTSRTRNSPHFKSRHIGELPEDKQTNLNMLTGLTSQLDAATQALARAQQDKTFC